MTDEKSLFEIELEHRDEPIKVFDVNLEYKEDVMIVNWSASVGFGRFVHEIKDGGLYLDTEHMGKEFCAKIIEKMFLMSDSDVDGLERVKDGE